MTQAILPEKSTKTWRELFDRVRVPLRLPERQLASKWPVALAIALAASLLALALRLTPRLTDFVFDLDETLYDACYELRPPQDMRDASVVIVGIDDAQLNEMDKRRGVGWPWPREYYVPMMDFAARHDARAVAFDLLFNRTSYYQHGPAPDDDQFADGVAAVREAGLPVVFATHVPDPDKQTPDERAAGIPFGPPVADPVFGAANVSEGKVTRFYKPVVHGHKSLAAQALVAAGMGSPESFPRERFPLHYYGPHVRPDGRQTFRYVSAYNLFYAAQAKTGDPRDFDVDPEWFRGKIVLVGTVSAGTYDMKSTPLSAEYPGVELHATAIENLLRGQRVRPVGRGWMAAVTFVGALLASLGAMLPRGVVAKLLAGALVLFGIVALSVGLFLGRTVEWMPMAAPLIATSVAVVGAMGWSYMTEDRSRRFILRAFRQYVAPEVAERVSRDPKKLALGGERREMTVLFSDIAGFTDMSEKLSAEGLSHVINFYLDEMSKVVLEHVGTLDKYIGDAVMCFWNAPLDQPDHAAAACRAALGMLRREARIVPQLTAMGVAPLHTRIGINTGPMAVGNMGSTHRFSYTVIGDAVNLAARLEGANKAYGTQIMVAESTAAQVRGKFLFRPLDVLRVKGKQKPVAVFELMAEGPGDERQAALARDFDAAFRAYQAQRWDDAEARLLEIRKAFPEDRPTAVLLGRVTRYRAEPPDAGWDGVFVMTEK